MCLEVLKGNYLFYFFNAKFGNKKFKYFKYDTILVKYIITNFFSKTMEMNGIYLIVLFVFHEI